MQMFQVWREDDPSHVSKINAFDAEEAAKEWARVDDWNSAEYAIVGGREEPTLVVQSADNIVRRFTVTGESVPHYMARERFDTEEAPHA